MKMSEQIGTVEPIGYFKEGEISEGIAFIRGAIAKYARNEEYHESLWEYIKKIANSNWGEKHENNLPENDQNPK